MWTITVLLAFAVAGALLAPHMVNTAAARDAVAARLAAALGQPVAIQGGLRFTLLPRVGFVVEGLQVADAGGFAHGTALKLDRAAVALAPGPLLDGRLVLDSVRLEGLDLRLERDAAGRCNWRPPVDRANAGDAPDTGGLPPCRRILVREGTLRVRDAVHGLELHFSRVGLQVRMGDDPRFNLETRVDCPAAPYPALVGGAARLRLAGHASLGLERKAFAVHDTAVELVVLDPRRPRADPLANLALNASADWTVGWLRLERLRCRAYGGRIEGRLEARRTPDGPELTGALALAAPELAPLWRRIGLPDGRAGAWRLPRAADLKADLAAAPGRLAVTAIEGRIDDVAVNGALQRSTTGTPRWQLRLTTGAIDLDAYRIAGAAGSRGTGEQTAPPLPAGGVDFDLDAEALRWRGTRWDRVRLSMHRAAEGAWRVDPVTASWAGGQWSGSGTLDLSRKAPAVTMALEGRGISLAALCSRAGMAAPPVGDIDLDLALDTRGREIDTLARNASGRLAIRSRSTVSLPGSDRWRSRGRLRADLQPGRRVRVDLSLQAPRPELRATLSAEGRWEPSGNVDLPHTRLRLTGGGLLSGAAPIDLAGHLRLRSASRRVELQGLRLSGFGLEGGGRAEADLAGDTPSIRARLAVDAFDPRRWLAARGWTPPPAADPMAWRTAALSVDLNCDGRSVAIRDLQLEMDGSRLRGIVDLNLDAPERVRFMLDVDRLDLDRYLPPPGAGKPDRPPGPNLADRLAGLDLAGTLTVGHFEVLRLAADGLYAEILVRDGRIRLDPFTMDLYGGRAEGRFTLAGRESEPVWRLRAGLGGVELHDPLEAIFGMPVLSGRADAEGELWWRPPDALASVAGLDGRVDLVVTGGFLHGVQIVPDVIAGRPSGPSDASAPPRQAYDEIRGGWEITDGVALAEEHRLTGPHLAMTGSGRVDFVDERLDVVITTDIRGIPEMHYTLAGPWDDVAVAMDRGRLAADTAARIVTSPLEVGRGALGAGADLLDRGRQAIGDGTGAQQVGQGVAGVGKGVLEMGRGVLDLDNGGEGVAEGAREVGQGAVDMGRGVIGIGRDAVTAGTRALEGLGGWLEGLFQSGEGSGKNAAPPAADSAPLPP